MCLSNPSIPIGRWQECRPIRKNAAVLKTTPLQTLALALCWGMAYSDALSPRWDRAAGFVVWFVVGFVLIEALSGIFIGDCISEPCSPSLGWRMVALIVAAYSLSAVIGWAAAKLVSCLINRRAG